MLTVTSTAIDAVKIITPKLIADSRGAFCETYNQERFAEHGIMPSFVQDNQSVSTQSAPFVACISKAIRSPRPNWFAYCRDEFLT